VGVHDAEGGDVGLVDALCGDYGVGSAAGDVSHSCEVVSAQQYIIAECDTERSLGGEPVSEGEQRSAVAVAVAVAEVFGDCLHRDAVAAQHVQVGGHDEVIRSRGDNDSCGSGAYALGDDVFDGGLVPDRQHFLRDGRAERTEPRRVPLLR
jgi:hypothetical protein